MGHQYNGASWGRAKDQETPTPEHDAVCAWLLDHWKPKVLNMELSERTRTLVESDAPEEEPYVELEHIILKGEGDYASDQGAPDLLVWYRNHSLALLLEAKGELRSVGGVIRQVKHYAIMFNEVHGCNARPIVVINELDATERNLKMIEAGHVPYFTYAEKDIQSYRR